MATVFARLYPHNPKMGFMVRGFNYRSFGFVGGERPNWYEVDETLAAELRELRQQHTDPRSQPLFQLCSAEEKVRLEHLEQSHYLSQLGVVSQTVSLPKEFSEPKTTRLSPLSAPVVIPQEPIAAPAPSVSPLSVAMPPPPTTVIATPAGEGRAAATPAPRSAGRRSAKLVMESNTLTTADMGGDSIKTEADAPGNDGE